MDFDKYVDCLTQIDNDECRARWETFYTLNRGVLSSFVAIDNAIQEVLKSRYISDEAMKQVESVLPSLSRLKIEIEKIQRTPEDLSDKYRAKVESAIYTLQNAMTLSEIPLFEDEFIQLLKKNNKELERETSRKKETEMIRKKEEEERRRLEEKDNAKMEEIKALEIQFMTDFDALNNVSIVDLAIHSRREDILLKLISYYPNSFNLLSFVQKNPYATPKVKELCAEKIQKIRNTQDDGNDWSDGRTVLVVILIIIAILFILWIIS